MYSPYYALYAGIVEGIRVRRSGIALFFGILLVAGDTLIGRILAAIIGFLTISYDPAATNARKPAKAAMSTDTTADSTPAASNRFVYFEGSGGSVARVQGKPAVPSRWGCVEGLHTSLHTPPQPFRTIGEEVADDCHD